MGSMQCGAGLRVLMKIAKRLIMHLNGLVAIKDLKQPLIPF